MPCSKGFQAFLGSSACAASATSYHFLQRCAALVAQRFFVGCALVQVRALPFGLRV
nr:DUF1010 domain-containing protein [Klebsiella oxytoca]